MNEISRSIELEARNEHFHFEASGRRDWLGGNPATTAMMNALSVTFPEGEKFFMDSVKHYRDQIDDPTLRKQIKGFLMQEAMHTREHVRYNEQLDEQGYSATKQHLFTRKMMGLARRHLSPKQQLAATCALEHFTAILADQLLRHPEYLADAEDAYSKVWRWHAIEEAEHKGVAFDTYQTITKGGGYFMRVRVMLFVSLMFNFMLWRLTANLMKDVGVSRSPKAWASLAWFVLGKPGLFRRMFLPWAAYFRPGFHPWEHDNRKELARTEEELLGSSIYSEGASGPQPAAA